MKIDDDNATSNASEKYGGGGSAGGIRGTMVSLNIGGDGRFNTGAICLKKIRLLW